MNDTAQRLILPSINDNACTLLRTYENAFSQAECDMIMRQSAGLISIPGNVGTGKGQQHKNINVRNVDAGSFPANSATDWIYDKFVNYFITANTEFWNFDITGIVENLQFLTYDGADTHYSWHQDTGPGNAIRRKMTAILQLSDSSEYVGGSTVIFRGDNQLSISKGRGSISIFPSYQFHKVMPLISGKRNCIVGWLQGPLLR